MLFEREGMFVSAGGAESNRTGTEADGLVEQFFLKVKRLTKHKQLSAFCVLKFLKKQVRKCQFYHVPIVISIKQFLI